MDNKITYGEVPLDDILYNKGIADLMVAESQGKLFNKQKELDNTNMFRIFKKKKLKDKINSARHDLRASKDYQAYVDTNLMQHYPEHMPGMGIDNIANNIEKVAMEKIAEAIIDKNVKGKIGKEVAEMLANSHEYKGNPNYEHSIKFANNYTWTKKKVPLSKLEGIDKPIKGTKVLDIANSIKKSKMKVNPFIAVNKLQGITPQTKQKYILIDGHHRHEACKLLEMKEVDIYYGTYTGDSEKEIKK